VGPNPCAFISRTLVASIKEGRPLPAWTPFALARAMPSSWRSLRRFVSNFANTPSISRKHLPAASEVSIGCSVAFKATPRQDDVLQIAQGAGEPVDSGDHQGVAFALFSTISLVWAWGSARRLRPDA
jgi:hypothetical protein